MEHIIERMQDDNAGVSVKNVKTFMNKIPSVFTGMYQLFKNKPSILLFLYIKEGRISLIV